MRAMTARPAASAAIAALLLLTGCGSRSASQNQLPPAAEAEGSDVVDFQLITPTDGWVLTKEALSMTDDGGGSWRDMTPPTLPPDSIAEVFFLTPTEGWALATEDVTEDASDQWLLFSTKDGGRTWIALPFPSQGSVEGRGAPVFIDFVNESDGWVMVKQPSSAQFSVGRLFHTDDGGTTWTELDVPIGGEINFIDRSTGWTVGGPRGDELYRITDAGETWNRVSITPPPEFREATPVYGIPIWPSADLGLLAVTFTGRRAVSGFAFYSSTDQGLTWELPGPVVPSPKSIALGVSVLADAVSDGTWFAVDPQRAGELFVARNRGEQVEQLPAEGLPDGVFHLDFANPTTGWAAAASEKCPQKTNCVYRSILLATDNGGDAWQRLAPP